MSERRRMEGDKPARARLSGEITAVMLSALLFGCSSGVPAQVRGAPAVATDQIARLRAEVESLHQQRRDRDAEPVAERLVTVIETAPGRDPLDVASCLCAVAPIYEANGKPARAEELYLRALAIREKRLGGQHLDVAAVLVELGRLYHAHRQYPRAEELYGRALTIREAVLGPDHPATAVVLGQLGKLHHDRRDYPRAEALYRRALAIQEAAIAKGGADLVTVVRDMAALSFDRGDYVRAETLYQRTLALTESSVGGEHPDTATALSNLATAEQKLGNYVQAEQRYRQALAIDERVLGREHPDVATLLNNMASLLDARGEYATAVQLYERALAIREQVFGKDHVQVATVLNNLASLHQSLGSYDKAEALYRRSLTIREATLGGASPEVGASLNNLGGLYEAKGDLAGAEPLYQRALQIYRQTFGDDHPDTEAVNGNIASLLLRRGDLDAAASIIRRTDWPVAMGSYYLAKRDYRNAHAEFMRSLVGADQKGESRHLLPTYLGMGVSLEGLNQPVLAAANYRAAVELIEQQRAALGAGDRAEFLGGSVGAGFPRMLAYEGLLRTSIKMGDLSEALRWAEHIKARQLLDASGHGRTAPGVPVEVADEERTFVDRLQALEQQRQETFSKNPGLYVQIENDLLPSARHALEGFVAQLRREYPAYAAYKYPRPLAAAEIALAPNEVLLEFAVTDEQTFAWVVRGGKVVKVSSIPAGRAALQRLIVEYRTLFKDIHRTSDLRSDVVAGRQLYDLLLKDSLAVCTPGERLVIVPDGSLGLLPFEALVMSQAPSGTDADPPYVGDAFPISYAQSATVMMNARALTARGGRSERDVFVLADPVFDPQDSRWPSRLGVLSPIDRGTSSSMGVTVEWSRLPSTEKLVRSLQDGFGSSHVAALQGAEASEATLRKRTLSGYQYLVFATHGLLGLPPLDLHEPALVLSQVGITPGESKNDGYLTLSEVAALRLDADAVALTACETGIGKNVSGEGVMGMGWAFQYAGVRNALMTLWPVDEQAAVQLTASFFNHLHAGQSPQDALRQARGELHQQGYRHPFFWAAFVMMGAV